jgi:hypothetical protein
MKLFVSFLLLATSAIAQTSITGKWQGSATVHNQPVPIRLEITGSGNDLHAALLNGPESSPASSAVFTGNHLLLTFNYYARTLEATLADGHLTGTFGTASTRFPLSLSSHGTVTGYAGPVPQDIS